MVMKSIVIKGEEFVLDASGCLFWKGKSMLLISDVHLGKIGHFRKFGAPIPQKAVHKNFILLDAVIAKYQPFQLCFLGDLFHSSINKEWVLFENWVHKTPTEIILVAGNHDIISPLKFEELGITLVQELLIGDFLLTHHPEERNGSFNLCGHIHPAVRLQGHGRQRLKLPCFFKKPRQLILPAFGEFTGTFVLEPTKEDEVFVLAENEVFKI